MSIKWKDIPGYEGMYRVSNDGQVKSLSRKEKSKANSTRIRKGQFMKPKLTHDGYHEHTLSKACKREYIRTHRIVMMAFSPIDEYMDMEVNHINGIKLDNRLENLEWVTTKANIQHSIEIGLQNPVGSSNANAKTTEEQVISARRLKSAGLKNIEISNELGIPASRVKQIVNNVTWKHLPSKEDLANDKYATI